TGPFLYSLDGEDYGPSPQFFNLSGGSYTVYVIDANQCAGSAEITIDAGAALDVQLVVRSNGGKNTIAFGDSLLLEAVINRDSAGVDSIAWFPVPPGCSNCRRPFVRPEQTTTYTVTVTDTDGCRAAASITVFVEQKYRYFIPNAFSPNEDGRNDVFFVYAGPEIRRIVTLRILDRWGNMVYSREDFLPNNPDFGWDGLFRGKLVPAGAYAFVAELELITGQVIVENGALTVVY
ncbi:MAG: gliding motility-associated C-terminal domain-containing protein, partial [Phaeodactylibacter sp.]|nr:gliding motility-associated C-terminal domain-containing protein [Phaeodactylibacter sp.]